MCQTFYRPTDPQTEQQFQAWMRENPGGYVFNHFGGANPRYNRLHRLPCRGLSRANAGVPKICCTNRTSVEHRIAELRDPGGWGECGLGCCGQYTSSTPGLDVRNGLTGQRAGGGSGSGSVCSKSSRLRMKTTHWNFAWVVIIALIALERFVFGPEWFESIFGWIGWLSVLDELSKVLLELSVLLLAGVILIRIADTYFQRRGDGQ